MKRLTSLCLFCLLQLLARAQELTYTVTPVLTDTPYFKIALTCKGIRTAAVEFSLPVWTPGYYQFTHYAAALRNFKASDAQGHALSFKQDGENSWQVQTTGKPVILLQYEVRSTRPFVAANYLEADRGYISPAGMFMHIKAHIALPATIAIKPIAGWNLVATGLDPVKGRTNTYQAKDFDQLYDSPILMGKLDTLPSFTVGGKLHRFVAYQPGEFDEAAFIQDMQKIVTAASDIIGDIPYQHYTFLSIGPSRGGIEHLNSAAVGFTGKSLNTREGKIGVYHFLAHEYFHHYNVKRIRPIELGPFDYDHGSKTRLLWVSEGFTVYYEYLAVKRAGITTQEEVLHALQKNMHAYESKPGRLIQSAAASSYETWNDGPFGAGDSSISYYDKGPVLGAMMDLKIRYETQNKHSLDDVMRALYREYYQQKKSGFTEAEFRATAERIAGVSLAECFDYANTVKVPDYKKYFGYAGLDVAVEDGSYALRPKAAMDALQASIFKDWLR